jgi:site-specific DNA-methyltransferase (adenine-specific)
MLNTVIFGNCLEVLPTLPDKYFNLILTDLPYAITSNRYDKKIIPFDKLWEQYRRLITDNGVVALTASQPFTSECVMSNREWFRHEWIWIKNQGSNFANTVREPMKEHESILIFSPGKWTYNPQMQERTGSGSNRVKYPLNWNSQSNNYRAFEGRQNQERPNLRVPSSWQKFNVEKGLHPNQKPSPLFEYLIKTYTNKGDNVLDSCCGSGTTAIASIITKRNYVLIENDKEYFSTAVERIKNFKNNQEIDIFDGI